MTNIITLESLIEEHKKRMPTLIDTGAMYSRYKYPNMAEYTKWLELTKRYIAQKYSNDISVSAFESICKIGISPSQQEKLLAVLEALQILPDIISDNSQYIDKSNDKEPINIVTNINNTNNQSQSQEQSLAVELFLDAIKNDLTGRQIKELKEVVAEADNDFQKARPSIVAKLKEFGADVASNIIANILTNPIIWGGL
ncbi:MAG: peptide chain release factor 1 [Bacteroidales bacterium]|nr:peptide chain release factor 1 [Bacteroidales bacterium]